LKLNTNNKSKTCQDDVFNNPVKKKELEKKKEMLEKEEKKKCKDDNHHKHNKGLLEVLGLKKPKLHHH
jgi:hypothetical protein